MAKENQQLKGADELVEAAQKSETKTRRCWSGGGVNTVEATDIRRIMGTETKTVGISVKEE
jgi:hypothetical protein